MIDKFKSKFITFAIIEDSAPHYIIIMRMPIWIAFYLIFSTCSPTNSTKQEVWHQKLQSCPCRNPDFDSVKLNDGWAKDQGDIATYHAGATECFRSYPPVTTTEGMSGQQCCYDSEGNLITAGSAAGTPDKVSTCDGENNSGIMTIRYGGILGHLRKDVQPWKELGWEKYNTIWMPNKGRNCAENLLTKGVNPP